MLKFKYRTRINKQLHRATVVNMYKPKFEELSKCRLDSNWKSFKNSQNADSRTPANVSKVVKHEWRSGLQSSSHNNLQVRQQSCTSNNIRKWTFWTAYCFFFKKCSNRSDNNGTLIIGRGLLICTNCTTYSFAKLDRQMFDVCSKRSALEATGRQLLLFLLVQSLDKCRTREVCSSPCLFA